MHHCDFVPGLLDQTHISCVRGSPSMVPSHCLSTQHCTLHDSASNAKLQEMSSHCSRKAANVSLAVSKFLLCTGFDACMPNKMSLMPVGLPKKWCSLKAWLWASSTVCSRTMHVPFSKAGALTPFGDLHNYHPPPPPHYPEIGELCCYGCMVCSIGLLTVTCLLSLAGIHFCGHWV